MNLFSISMMDRYLIRNGSQLQELIAGQQNAVKSGVNIKKVINMLKEVKVGG